MIFSSDTTGAARIGFAVVGAKADLPIAMEPASHGTSLVGAATFEGADIGQLTQMLDMGRPPLEVGPQGFAIHRRMPVCRGYARLSYWRILHAESP
jgi:hypothetical protein